MKKLPFKTFQIHAGTYDFDVNVCITQDIDRAVKFVNFKFELPTDFEKPMVAEDFTSANGKVFRKRGYCPVLWMPESPSTPDQYGVLYHELFHVVCSIMRWANIPLSDDSEEAYCHLIKYLTKEILNKLR